MEQNNRIPGIIMKSITSLLIVFAALAPMFLFRAEHAGTEVERFFDEGKEVVQYRDLTPGKEYSIKSLMKDKAAGEPLGGKGSWEYTFVPEEPEGYIIYDCKTGKIEQGACPYYYPKFIDVGDSFPEMCRKDFVSNFPRLGAYSLLMILITSCLSMFFAFKGGSLFIRQVIMMARKYSYCILLLAAAASCGGVPGTAAEGTIAGPAKNLLISFTFTIFSAVCLMAWFCFYNWIMNIAAENGIVSGNSKARAEKNMYILFGVSFSCLYILGTAVQNGVLFCMGTVLLIIWMLCDACGKTLRKGQLQQIGESTL